MSVTPFPNEKTKVQDSAKLSCYLRDEKGLFLGNEQGCLEEIKKTSKPKYNEHLYLNYIKPAVESIWY